MVKKTPKDDFNGGGLPLAKDIDDGSYSKSERAESMKYWPFKSSKSSSRNQVKIIQHFLHFPDLSLSLPLTHSLTHSLLSVKQYDRHVM